MLQEDTDTFLNTWRCLGMGILSVNYWEICKTHGTHSLAFNRQHLSYDVCLEVRGEIIETVLCCIVY